MKLKNGTFKSHKIDTVDWNNQENAEVWWQAWADISNRYLAAQGRTELIDHRFYQRQEIEQIPTKQQDAYYEKYRAELTLFEAALNHLKKVLRNDSALKPQTWKTESAALFA